MAANQLVQTRIDGAIKEGLATLENVHIRLYRSGE